MQIKSQTHVRKKFLFFISQDYSFPVLRPLQDAIWERGDEVKWFMYGKEIHKESILDNEIVLETIQETIEYNPDAVFVPGNVVPSFIPGLKVEVFHGLPGEKRTRKGQVYHYIIRGMFDLYCTQGPSSTKVFKKLSKKYGFFHVCETGWCKLDPLFSSTHSQRKDKKSIFFASTFSPRYTKAEVLYPFILQMIEKYDYHWYITLHPIMNHDTVKKYKSIQSSKVTFISSIETIQYFKKSDIMLCDISSIIYEYMTQIKPVITFQSKQKSHAIINTENFQKLEEKLVLLLNSSSNEINHKIKREVNTYHPYNDGKSSLRVLNCVDDLLKQNDIVKRKKPLNILRNLKLRKVLNYWKF